MAQGGPDGHWPSPWPAEDGGPLRQGAPHGTPGLDLRADEQLAATSRDLAASTMCVLRDPGEVFVLCHTMGADTVAWLERIDPHTLETLDRSDDLPAGPMWPGGVVAHADGSLVVTYGRWCHKLGADLSVLARHELPRDRPYNSLVVLPDGALVMKDFGIDGAMPAELVVLDPATLEPLAAPVAAPEPSIARLSADAEVVYVVGDRSAFRYRWDGAAGALELDDGWRVPYRTREGQGYGWDAVLAGGSIWFLDDGEGTEGYLAGGGSLVGQGVATEPLSLVAAPVVGDGAAPRSVAVSGRPGGIVANPPTVDPDRRVAVAFDTGNATVVGVDLEEVDGALLPGAVRWRRDQAHGCHLIRYPDTGEVVADHHEAGVGDHVVVLDVLTGEERGRVATGSPVQSVLFGCTGWERDLYLSTFTTLTRVHVA